MTWRRFAIGMLAAIGAWYLILPTVYGHFRTIADINTNECQFNPDDPEDPDNKSYPSPPPVVKIMALTDSGELSRRCQWTDALYELAQVDQPKRVFVYVHGWRHNSETGDTDLGSFRELIEEATSREKQRGGNRHVVGIYMGWDAATPIPGLEFLTFWDRKQTADRISQSTILAKFLGAARNILLQQDAARQEADRHKDQVIVIGHSFGARIVYSALAAATMLKAQSAHPGRPGGTYKIVDGVVDFTVLLNPALEAGAYSAFDSMRRYKENFNDAQPPVMISIGTDNDWATQWFFPLGQWIGLARSEREQTTLGNYRRFFTHELVAENEGSAAGGVSSWDRFCSKGLCLNRADAEHPNNPFFITATTASILDGHNGIWGKTFRSWMMDLFDALDEGRAARLAAP